MTLLIYFFLGSGSPPLPPQHFFGGGLEPLVLTGLGAELTTDLLFFRQHAMIFITLFIMSMPYLIVNVKVRTQNHYLFICRIHKRKQIATHHNANKVTYIIKDKAQ